MRGEIDKRRRKMRQYTERENEHRNDKEKAIGEEKEDK